LNRRSDVKICIIKIFIYVECSQFDEKSRPVGRDFIFLKAMDGREVVIKDNMILGAY